MSVAPKRRAASSRFVWMSMTMILDAPAMRATYGVETNPSGSKDHNSVAGADVCGIQDGTGASHYAAAEQRSLGERELLRHYGELVLMNERGFSEAAEAKALKQTDPNAA